MGLISSRLGMLENIRDSLCLLGVGSSQKEGLGRQIGGVFTFGAPRCGDKRFAALFSKAFAGRAFRYVSPRSFPSMPYFPSRPPLAQRLLAVILQPF